MVHASDCASTRRYDDFDDFAASLRGWCIEYSQLDRGPFTGRLTQVAGARTVLSHLQAGRSLEQRGGSSPHAWTFGVIDRDCSPFRCLQAEVSPGDLVVFPPDTELDSITQPGFSVFSFIVDEAYLAVVAENMELSFDRLVGEGGICRGPVGRTGALRRLFRKAVHPAQPGTTAHGSNDTDPPLEFETTRSLLECLQIDVDAHSRHSMLQRQQVFARARDTVESAGHEPLTVEQLCRAVGTSRRTLHRSFKETCGVSTKEYLQARRLNGVRRLLRVPAPPPTVADAANRWGFWHMGQFAADYRQHFGELPSETLQHARARMSTGA